jgi:hypothetical protein
MNGYSEFLLEGNFFIMFDVDVILFIVVVVNRYSTIVPLFNSCMHHVKYSDFPYCDYD